MTTVTVRTYKDNGPYFNPTIMKYSAHSLKEVVFHVRQALEDHEDYIGVFHGDECKGFWEDDSEPEFDGEDGYYWPHACYVLRRPSERFPHHFLSIVKLLRQA